MSSLFFSCLFSSFIFLFYLFLNLFLPLYSYIRLNSILFYFSKPSKFSDKISPSFLFQRILFFCIFPFFCLCYFPNSSLPFSHLCFPSFLLRTVFFLTFISSSFNYFSYFLLLLLFSLIIHFLFCCPTFSFTILLLFLMSFLHFPLLLSLASSF